MSHLASLSGDPDWEFPLTLKEGVPLGVSDPTLTSRKFGPLRRSLREKPGWGKIPPRQWLMITTQLLNSLPRKSNQPFTRNEPWTWWTGPSLAPRRQRGAAANRRNFARAPLQGLMSRTRSGRSTMAQKGEQTRTSRLTRRRRPPHRWLETASMPPTGSGQRRTILICSEPHPRPLMRNALKGTPTAPACPQGKGPLPGAEGPDRRAPFPPTPPGRASWSEHLTWQPPTQGETFIILKADVTKAHRRIKVLQKDWKYQVACIQNRWWVNRVGTYGMASAQLYWGRKASLVLRLLYYIFPQVDWHLVFVDDYCWVLRCSRADWDAAAILATLLALGVPLSWKKTALSPVNTWLGFVVDPITPCVLLAPVKHVIILATGSGGHLHQQGGGTSPEPDSMGYFGVSIDETFPPALLELEEGLHHFGQATEAGSCSGHPSRESSSTRGSHWHLHLLPHFHGRGHLMRELANRRTMHGLVVGARTCPTPTSPE